ncbi:MAG: hypothetical protein IPN04_06775 [Rhodoferax sp.]|nr:hypothetical protein [Rhodoferax sp.]
MANITKYPSGTEGDSFAPASPTAKPTSPSTSAQGLKQFPELMAQLGETQSQQSLHLHQKAGGH